MVLKLVAATPLIIMIIYCNVNNNINNNIINNTIKTLHITVT